MLREPLPAHRHFQKLTATSDSPHYRLAKALAEAMGLPYRYFLSDLYPLVPQFLPQSLPAGRLLS